MVSLRETRKIIFIVTDGEPDSAEEALRRLSKWLITLV
jgi:hypothetical protein